MSTYNASAAEPLKSGVESDQGTEATRDRIIGFNEEEVEHADPSIDWTEKYYLGGGRTASRKGQGQVSYDGGTLPIIPFDGYPIALLLGSDSLNGSNEHVITPLGADNTQAVLPPSFTLEAYQYGDTDFGRLFLGCVASSGSLSVSNDGDLQVELDITAQGVDTSLNSPTDVGSPPQREPWSFSDVSSNLSLFGTSFAEVNDFELSVDNNTTQKYYLDSNNGRDPSRTTYGNAGFELTAEVEIGDPDIYNELQNPTTGGFTASMAFTKASGDSITINCYQCNIAESSHPQPEEGEVVSNVTIVPTDVEVIVNDIANTSSTYI